jgi:glycosyltransferase involved in cell wall biosynthesis
MEGKLPTSLQSSVEKQGWSGSRRVLIIVQNLPVPFDRRVWQEANELVRNGYTVSIICPLGKGYDKRREVIDGIEIHRHPLPFEANGALGYLIEYSSSLFWEFWLSWRVFFGRGFDVIHACNPPDNIFLVAGFFKIFFRKKFLFDHHDINPELYEAKFGKRDILYKLMLWWERLTFFTADVSIATNNSYRQIAIERGKMRPEKVFVVRSGPSLERLKILPPDVSLKMGKKFLIGYVGVIGQQEGIQYLIQAARHIVYDLNRTDIHFTLVGGGPALNHYQEMARQAKLDEHMTFLGRVSDQILLSVLNTSDVCVNPDEVNPMNDKSTMNKIMEYMALGKPIVQFDVTEGRFSAGAASLYAKPNDSTDLAEKLLSLLDDPEAREAMAKFGRTRVQNSLAWQYEAPKLLAAYDAVFSRVASEQSEIGTSHMASLYRGEGKDGFNVGPNMEKRHSVDPLDQTAIMAASTLDCGAVSSTSQAAGERV